MTHLTPQEFVDALDDALAPERRTHLDACEACRDEAAGLGMLMNDVRVAGDVPEPAPFFWDRLSARIAADVGGAGGASGVGWWRSWQPLAVVGALAVVVGVAMMARPRPTVVPLAVLAPSRAAAAAVEPAAIAPRALDAPSDASGPAYEFVVQMAAQLPSDELQKLEPATPDAADGMLDHLTPAERAEFARLLKAEMTSGGEQ